MPGLSGPRRVARAGAADRLPLAQPPGQPLLLSRFALKVLPAIDTPRYGDQFALGVPPHWGLYIAVTSADESAKRAIELGATVLAGPFDVMDKGRMSVVRDP